MIDYTNRGVGKRLEQMFRYPPAGTYRLRVSAPGFRTSDAGNIILRLARTLTVNMTLEIGQVSERVTVSDKPPLLESGYRRDQEAATCSNRCIGQAQG